METPRSQSLGFWVGDWLVRPDLGRIERGDTRGTLEPRAMGILVYLAEHQGEVVSADELIDALWAGQIVGDNTVYQWVYLLRKALGDDPHHPAYIATFPKKGYRLIARVERLEADVAAGPSKNPVRQPAAWLALVAVSLVAILFLVFRHGSEGPLPNPSIATGQDGRPSIAVLPFADNSERGSGLQIANGLHDMLLTMLGRLKSVRVISRTSVTAYRDTNKNLTDIGEELGVTHIIEGGIQRADDRILVNIQLIDAQSDDHLWAAHYDRELKDSNLFEIQFQIARAVTEVLALELTADEEHQFSSLPTHNLAAQEAYMMGKHQLNKRTLASLEQAVGFFSEAVSLDPGFALAYVGLADAYGLLDGYDGEPSRELRRKAASAIEQALVLDNSLGEAYASRGMLLSETDPKLSETTLVRSIELSPNYASARHWYGNLLWQQGRLDEALAQYEKARELDPLSPIINAEKAFALEAAGRFEEALAQYQRVALIDPNFRQLNFDQGILLWFGFGRIDRAHVHFHNEMSVPEALDGLETADTARMYSDMAFASIDLGDFDRASEWIRQALELEAELAGAVYAGLLLRLLGGEAVDRADYPDELQALESVLESEHISPLFVTNVLKLLRLFDLQEHSPQRAADRYASKFPELLHGDSPKVDGNNYLAAIDLALVLQLIGKKVHAEQLLEGSVAVIRGKPRLGFYGYGIADVVAKSLRGDSQGALAALGNAVDAGWRSNARYYLELEPALQVLHDDPAYRSIVSEVYRDLAAQLENVRRMEQSGVWDLAAAQVRTR